LENSIRFCASLTGILLHGNQAISESKLKAIGLALKAKSRFNQASVYLLGYGETGKTSLRKTIKNYLHWTSWYFKMNWMAPTVQVNEQTKGLEVERGLLLGDGRSIQVIDFGGQHHYHHSTHLFMRGSLLLS